MTTKREDWMIIKMSLKDIKMGNGCHKAKTVLSFLEEEEIAVMKWPLQSPVMNPIENA